MGVVPRVHAGFYPSGIAPLPQVDRTADLETIKKVLEAKMVRARLEQLGFSQEEIQARLSQLSDQQIHQLALNLEDIKVGGNLAEGFGALVSLVFIGVIGAAVLVTLVIHLILKATHTD